jgi:hypothetical protein
MLKALSSGDFFLSLFKPRTALAPLCEHIMHSLLLKREAITYTVREIKNRFSLSAFSQPGDLRSQI